MNKEQLVEKFGVMNFRKIQKIRDKINDGQQLLKHEAEYIIYAFDYTHDNFINMLSVFQKYLQFHNGKEQAKVHAIYEYMKKMNLDFDHNVLEECSEDLHLDIIEEFDNFEIDDDEDDECHRDDGPALTLPDGTVKYYQNNKLHRDDGPAVIYPDGNVEYYQNGKYHRDNGPAIIYPEGTVAYYQNGKLHRDDGPAVLWPTGTVEYYQKGKLHRNDGPAVIHPNGTVKYYQNGELIAERKIDLSLGNKAKPVSPT